MSAQPDDSAGTLEPLGATILPAGYVPPGPPRWLAGQRPGESVWDALVRGWLLRSPSEETRDAYARDIAAWVAFLGTATTPLLAERVHVDAFARSLEVARYSANTRRRRLSAVSSLYEYAIERGARAGENPARYVSRPPVPTGRRRHLTQEQAMALLETADTVSHEHRELYAVVVRLFLYLALRVSEVCRLDVRDYDRATGQLIIRGKGGSETRMDLPEQILAALEAYLPHRAPPRAMADPAGRELEHTHPGGRGAAREPLFYLRWPHVRGAKPSRGPRLTPDAITSRLRELAKLAGLPPALAVALTPHDLRHTALTLLSRRAPFAEVVATGRHRRADTTLLYIHPDPEDSGPRVLARALEPTWEPPRGARPDSPAGAVDPDRPRGDGDVSEHREQ